MTEVARRYELACGHEVWFKYVPDVEDIIWCVKCQKETQFVQAGATQSGRYYQEDFWSERIHTRYRGGCLHKDCYDEEKDESSYTHITKSWFALRDNMHSHFMRMHTSRTILDIRIKPIPSTPDF